MRIPVAIHVFLGGCTTLFRDIERENRTRRRVSSMFARFQPSPSSDLPSESRRRLHGNVGRRPRMDLVRASLHEKNTMRRPRIAIPIKDHGRTAVERATGWAELSWKWCFWAFQICTSQEARSNSPPPPHDTPDRRVLDRYAGPSAVIHAGAAVTLENATKERDCHSYLSHKEPASLVPLPSCLRGGCFLLVTINFEASKATTGKECQGSTRTNTRPLYSHFLLWERQVIIFLGASVVLDSVDYRRRVRGPLKRPATSKPFPFPLCKSRKQVVLGTSRHVTSRHVFGIREESPSQHLRLVGGEDSICRHHRQAQELG